MSLGPLLPPPGSQYCRQLGTAGRNKSSPEINVSFVCFLFVNSLNFPPSPIFSDKAIVTLDHAQSGDGKVQFVFKRVAVVEKFFDIIYSVHVESSSEDTPHLRGRAGKHCGQKRTYRAVSPGYSLHFHI